MRTEEFVYRLPAEAIAQVPVEPRHSARLLDTRDMTDRLFGELPELLHPGDLVVVNDTKVRAARLIGRKAGSGGRVEALVLERLAGDDYLVLLRPARRIRAGVEIDFSGLRGRIVADPVDGVGVVRLLARDTEAAIAAAGEVPLPPYIEKPLADPGRYQTVYANAPGSAAAPTAGLHFTEEVLQGLAERGALLARVELHVGLDTFRPITVDEVDDHVMHQEWCRVGEDTKARVEETRGRGGKVVAIGTTVVRTLESFADGAGGVYAGEKKTRLFIKPGFRFTVVDSLVTNFHMPASTLLVLLAAFMGRRWREAYETALQRGYRFLSFGDAMYADRAGPSPE